MTDKTASDAEPTDLKSALIELRHAREEITRLRPFVDMVDQAQRAADAAVPSAPATRGAVLTDEAALIEAHCPDHGPQDQDGVWMDCHCPVAEDMRKRAAELRRMAVEAQQPACPGYETAPNLCACDCEGCKHHCAAHQAGEAQQPETQAGCSQCGHRACMGRGRCGVVMTSEAGIVRPPCQCLGATRDVGARQADTAGEQQ